MRLLGHDPAEGASTEEVVREGERAAETGVINAGPLVQGGTGPGPAFTVSGPQAPMRPQQGPPPQQPPYPQGPTGPGRR